MKQKILELLSNQSGRNDIQDNDRLFEDLGISSLGMMMLLLDAEQALPVTIDFSKLVNVKTVGQLIDAIMSMG